MTLCIIDGKQCQCQPDDGSFCALACEKLTAAQIEIAKLKEALHWCLSHTVSYSSTLDQFLDNDGYVSMEIDPPESLNDVLREVARSL